MATTAGSPIVVDDFQAEVDALELLTATHSGQIADINIRVLRDANLGYKEHVAGDSDQIIASSGSLFSSIGLAVNTVADRIIHLTFSCRATSATAGDIVTFIIMDDDTMVGVGAGDATISANDGLQTVFCEALVTPSAGFHNYRIYVTMTNGVGPGGYIGSGSAPAWFIAEDIGEVA